MNEHILKLKQKRGELIEKFLTGQNFDFLRDYTSILDEYFCDSFEKSMVGPSLNVIKNPYAIVALGGYGRQEQCIYSDIDLLFVFESLVPNKTEELVREIVYPLWDLGLSVGHATRTVKECIKLGGEDFETLTSLIDGRFLCGISLLFSNLMEKLRGEIIHKQSGKIVDWLIGKNKKRHSNFGDSAYLLEPNLKEGGGGLRDYHTMLWTNKILSNANQPRDLEYYGYLSNLEYESLSSALSFIWKVRNYLHYLTSRKCDQLYMEYQVKLSELLNYNNENGILPVEKFLKELHSNMEFIKYTHRTFLYEIGYSKRKRLNKENEDNIEFLGFKITKNMLNFNSPEDILKKPELLIKIFEESDNFRIPLSAQARRLIREFEYLINEDFRSNPLVIRSFERILSSQASEEFDILNEILNTGFLEYFIPEFKGIVNRIQYNEYHLYPVDKHSLKTVKKIKEFSSLDDNKNSLYHALFKKIKNKRALLWAALLHDIGKGESGENHSLRGAKISNNILKSKKFKEKDIETICWLIEKHLFLIKIATRRDINEEETAIFCAREIKDLDRLKMLYLLTVADSMATGHKAWNEWTSSLLRDLFLKIVNVIEKGELATSKATRATENKKKILIETSSSPEETEDILNIFNILSPRYLLYVPPDEIKQHMKLYKSIGKADFIWSINKASDWDMRTVTICAKDHPGLFSKISGTFTLNNIDILNAQVYTWRNNTAMDIFNAKPPKDLIFEDKIWEKTKTSLQLALSSQLNLKDALEEKMKDYRSTLYTTEKPLKVVIDNNSSSFFTIIEVFAYDFPGLLFTITNALFQCKLDIWVAKIATDVDQVVDIFYVRDFDGQKVDMEEQVSMIKKAIEDAIKSNYTI